MPENISMRGNPMPQVEGDNPAARLQQFRDWMSGAGTVNSSAGAMQSGLGGAGQTVQAGTAKVMELLRPYLQGGEEDYGNYRSKVNSGYYNTPFAGVFQGQQAPQQQQFKPTWNPQTQSFSSNNSPWNAQQQAPVQQQALPQWNRPSPPPQAQGGQQQGGPGMSIEDWIKKALMQAGRAGQEQTMGGSTRPEMLNQPFDIRDRMNQQLPAPLQAMQPGKPIQSFDIAQIIAQARGGTGRGQGSGPFMPSYGRV